MKMLPSTKRFLLQAFALLLAISCASAQVLTLDFAGGNGTTTVDQYTGTSGSGWNTAWTQGFTANATNTSATVVNTSPLYSGGGNYLQVSYDATSNATARVSRQWDTTALTLTDPVVLDFYFRSTTTVGTATQIFTLFGGTAATSATGASDSWRIAADGGGFSAFNGTTPVSLGTGPILAGVTFHFTLTFDTVANTYDISVTNMSTSATSSLNDLAFRSGNDLALGYMNFVSANSQAVAKTGLGYSIDGISLTAVPEPAVAASALLGGLLLTHFARRRQSSL
jgi:hypothetical protein